MKVRVVNQNKSLLGKKIAEVLKERLAKPVTEIPQMTNEDKTMAGDPLKGHMPSMTIWPFAEAVTGNGFGPVIGREPRTNLF